jgi:ubiquinone/menaquinone biosynthesis C-methylase UbiE
MYDAPAACYHLIFEICDASIARQAAALGPLIENASGKHPARILDAACGIGTQAIGLALRGPQRSRHRPRRGRSRRAESRHPAL